MDAPITRAEHLEFVKRMEDEHTRLNRRVKEVEEATKQYTNLIVSVERLAANMEQMLKEQVSQGERLEVLESRDGEMWRKVVGYAATAIVGVLIGYLFKQFM